MLHRRSAPQPPLAHRSGSHLDPLVDALATYRLTRLATADIISEPMRMALVRRTIDTDAGNAPGSTAQEVVEQLEEPSKLATLVTCRWCAGVWIAAGVAVARHAFPRAWPPVARALALSSAAVLLARLED